MLPVLANCRPVSGNNSGSPATAIWLHTQAPAARFSNYNLNMFRKRSKSGAPSSETGQEALYLKSLSERQVQVSIKLRDGEIVNGWIEYFDDMMVRLTRDDKPNLFIYKSQIRTIAETTDLPNRRSGNRRDPVFR